MAQVKNSFLKSKMNKDLDDRLIPNGEYRDAVNITVNQSDGEDVGTAQTILGNTEVINYNTVTGQSGLKTIGILNEDSTNTIFAFVTNNSASNYNKQAYNAIISWQTDLNNTTAKIIVEGNWLNFSTLNPMTGINLLEDLLFFTDNKNQPRKVNINNPEGYYTSEDQISVAKYYPYESILLYQPSENPNAIVATTTTTSATASNVIPVASASLVSIGQGVLLASGSSTEILYNTFVTSVDTVNLEVTVNQNVNLDSGATINFVLPETTMQDAISEYLPVKAEGKIIVAPTVATEFNLQNYKGYANMVGNVSIGGITPSVYVKNSNAWVDTGAKATSIQTDPNNPGFIVETDVASGAAINDEILIAIPNPYYDSNFAATANIDYLEDKFVRFSYRFKFDDGEYSLIAPFTQACFIPKQDGYFLDASFDSADAEDNLSDFSKAYRSTEVAFMENKVNKILLNVPLPYTLGTIANELKISEVEILYKESNEIAIKVVDAIPVSNFSGNNYYFQYEYGSKSPYKSLPEKENTRVYDKVPVKAQSQEIISNRVVYGNYQDKHTPPNFVDFNLAVDKKANFAPDVNYNGVSSIEYPNANVKQNRNYELGVVLSDRFGRQSTVILSESTLNNMPSYLASTIYSPYREDSQQSGSTAFDGDSLKVIFNNFIPSSYPNSPGLYEGNKNLSSYNPLGWYSYKLVVKQTEQDYYNVYVAPIMQGYPTDNNKEKFDTSHVSLFGDNINKIPRDLSELGPTQKQFRSSVKLWPRVAGDENTNSPFYNSAQFFPERTGDIASAIATVDDLFELPDAPGNVIGSFAISSVESNTTNTLTFSLGTPSPAEQEIFLGISEGDEIRGINFGYKDTIITDIVTPQTPPLSGIFKLSVSNPPQGSPNGNNISFHRSGGKNYFYNQESDPLIARISTTKQAGVKIPEEYPDIGGALNIYEVEAQESLLDIYWETSTSGLINELNQSIADGPGALIYNRTTGWSPVLSEGSDVGNNPIVSSFQAVLLNGQQITPVTSATATIVSVYEQGSPSNVTNLLGNPYADSFSITSIGNGFFDLDLDIDPSELVHTTGVNTLTFEILYEHPDAESTFTDFLDVNVNNVSPSIDVCPGDQRITNKTPFIYDFTGVNGSDTNSLNQEDLVWSLDDSITDTSKFTINQSGELRATNLQTPTGTYPIKVVLTDGGGAQDNCSFNVTYDYAKTISFNLSPNASVSNSDPYSSITQAGTMSIANGSYVLTFQGSHQGTNTTTWSTSPFQLEVYQDPSGGSTGSSDILSTGILNQAAFGPVTASGSITRAPGSYYFEITIDTNNTLPPVSGGSAQSLAQIIAT